MIINEPPSKHRLIIKTVRSFFAMEGTTASLMRRHFLAASDYGVFRAIGEKGIQSKPTKIFSDDIYQS
jgi:hypothetical protein